VLSLLDSTGVDCSVCLVKLGEVVEGRKYHDVSWGQDEKKVE
jgi:hypothetical protein